MDIDEEKLFYFRLAHEFKVVNVEEIYNLPVSVINGWKEYFSIYPFSDTREDIRNALLRAAIYNISGKKLKRDVNPKELLIDYIDEIKKRSSPRNSRNEQNLKYIQHMQKIEGILSNVKGVSVKKNFKRRKNVQPD